jgi:cysteinyl-tRNA synthetase
VIFELVKQANIALKPGCAKAAVQAVLDVLAEMTGVLGLLKPPQAQSDDQVDAMLAARAEARKSRNWAESDRLRDAQKEMGYLVEDTAQGQKVRKA